jgi:hypothetical protein
MSSEGETEASKEERIEAIPGLRELETAIRENLDYISAFEKSFDSEDDDFIQSHLEPPTVDIQDIPKLRKRYPQADAYLKMRALSNSLNDELAAIGSEAIEMVIDGNYEEGLAYAEEAQRRFCARHAWD